MKPAGPRAAKAVKQTKVAPAARAKSPYTGKTADSPMAHLERILSVSGVMTILGPNYWRTRASEIAESPGLTPAQHARIARIAALIERLASDDSPADLLGKAA